MSSQNVSGRALEKRHAQRGSHLRDDEAVLGLTIVLIPRAAVFVDPVGTIDGEYRGGEEAESLRKGRKRESAAVRQSV